MRHPAPAGVGGPGGAGSVKGASGAGSAASAPVRVLVVDDSATQRAALIALLEADPGISVVGWAADGAEAVRATVRLKPDVVAMDLRMPVMDGVEATRRIMEETPTPIVMVTASAARDDAVVVFDAMKAGVLAIVAKPTVTFNSPGESAPASPASAAGNLTRTLKAMSQVKVIRRWSAERMAGHQASTMPSTPAAPLLSPPVAPPSIPWHTTPVSSVPPLSRAALAGAGLRPEIIAIGASTGGPQALAIVLPALPVDFRSPVLVVQHIAPGFEPALVDWLGTLCALPVQLAQNGMPLGAPGIYIAPGGTHLVVQDRRLSLSTSAPVGGHRPSVTALFQSVAREYRTSAVGVLLSGMGDDGASGLRDLKRAGALTVAQDEATCVVFGMPAVAIAMGVVDRVLPPAQIGTLLASLPSTVPRRS
jgi:two-component system, chemotaxis family, protein-glutamate methylesterase/glutaminase